VLIISNFRDKCAKPYQECCIVQQVSKYVRTNFSIILLINRLMDVPCALSIDYDFMTLRLVHFPLQSFCIGISFAVAPVLFVRPRVTTRTSLICAASSLVQLRVQDTRKGAMTRGKGGWREQFSLHTNATSTRTLRKCNSHKSPVNANKSEIWGWRWPVDFKSTLCFSLCLSQLTFCVGVIFSLVKDDPFYLS
jgi:hypothetical protein